MHHLFGDHIALANRSMAFFTCGARLRVYTVAEVDKRRDPVDTDHGIGFFSLAAAAIF